MRRLVEVLERRPPGSARRWAAALAVLWIAGPWIPAAAQEPPAAEDRPAIGVRCELASPPLRSLYGPEGSAQVAAGLCQELVEEHLSSHPRLGFWRFRVAGAERGLVELEVEVRDGAATETLGRIQLFKKGLEEPFCEETQEVTAAASDRERRCWQAVIHDPGELGDPLPGEAPTVFGGRIREEILDHFVVEIEQQLKRKVPLARARWLEPTADPPALVAALPWSESQKLRKSEFLVLCRRADTPLQLRALGHPIPASFPPGGPPRIPEALVVLVSGPLGAADPSSLTPGGLYLVRYEPPEIDTIDDDFWGGGTNDGD